jgi:hypothetical protein
VGCRAAAADDDTSSQFPSDFIPTASVSFIPSRVCTLLLRENICTWA